MNDSQLIDNEFQSVLTLGKLPYSKIVLILGMIAILGFWIYIIPGIVCGIIAVVFHVKNKRLYLTNKKRYQESFKVSKVGFIAGLIGLILSSLTLLFFIVVIVIIGNTQGLIM